jgi:hypothetical protein
MFAAAIGVAVLPAFAQEQQKPKPEEEKEEKKKEEPKDPFDTGKKEEDKDKKLVMPRAANTASARSAPTTCISRAACGSARTAVTAT